MHRSEQRPTRLNHKVASALADIELEPIHNTAACPMFDSLLTVTIQLDSLFKITRKQPCCVLGTIILTEEEMGYQLSLILEPWDKRGILTVEGIYGNPLLTSLGASKNIQSGTLVADRHEIEEKHPTSAQDFVRTTVITMP